MTRHAVTAEDRAVLREASRMMRWLMESGGACPIEVALGKDVLADVELLEIVMYLEAYYRRLAARRVAEELWCLAEYERVVMAVTRAWRVAVRALMGFVPTDRLCRCYVIGENGGRRCGRTEGCPRVAGE